MFWQEDEEKQAGQAPVLDVLFQIDCRAVPLDHARELSAEICRALPWFADQPQAALHLIYGAASQNGWERPGDEQGEILLSRRSRLELRVPRERLEDARALSGQTLNIGGRQMHIGTAHEREINPYAVVFSRHVPADEQESENDFLARVVAELKQMDVPVKKALCGKTEYVQGPEGPIFTRRLMIADLKPEESVRIQTHGLGRLQKLGLGVFVPHKGIASIDK